MSPKNVLVDIIKKQVLSDALDNAEANKFRLKTAISPSMDLKCITQAWFRFKYSGGNYLEINPDEFRYENERAKVVGENFHNYMQGLFKKMGILRLNELTLVDDEHHIRARLDSVVEINNILYLIELKSTQQYPFNLMSEECSPEMEHQKQTQVYFHLLEVNKDLPEIKEATGNRQIRKGLIFYENKNKHTPMEFPVNRNDDHIKECLDYCKALWSHIEKDIQPKFKLEPDSFECKYCKPQFYEKCHGVKQPPKGLPDKNVWGYQNAVEVKEQISFRKDK